MRFGDQCVPGNLLLSPILRSKEFPEITVLVVERFVAADQEPKGVVAGGLFNGERIEFEVAVKNTPRPDGSATPWAYYDFTNSVAPSAALVSADEACEA